MADQRGKLGRGFWEFRLYKNRIEELDQPGGMLYRQIDPLAHKTASRASELAPRRSGKLSQSIKVTFENNRGRGGSRWYITAEAPYAAAVGKGAAPHVITAKSGGVLQFPVKGGTIVYRKAVQHPGNKPNDFMQRAMADIFR